VETIAAWWDTVPTALQDPVALAVPVFLVMLALESAAAIVLEEKEAASGDRPGRPGRGAYARQDALASIASGAVSIVTMSLWKLLALVVYAGLFAYVAPWQLDSHDWTTWVVAILGVDLLFYLAHRVAHRVRIVWATHQAHHSSEYFNFATALRQKWNNSAEIVMWLPLPLLGVPPWMVFTAFSISLVYQFFVHTEHVGRLWRPIELLFNTPSHHRVHHGSDPLYLDRNYGGILIVWDRLFGTFQEEVHRPTYGLTKPVGTHNIVKLQTHEYAAIARDVRGVPRLRDKLGLLLGPPGWRPEALEPES
jgi:sterol desaturase/sphingolipid hydroxylase (fatty acid hydroxylase superfamily)